jgi:hypothetical protein
MGTTYTICGDDVKQLIKAAMDTHHPTLSEAGVTVHAIYAERYDEDGEPIAAIKVHGVPAVAKIAITALEDRVRGIADAKLTIDRGQWHGMAESRRLALLDHELTHLVLKLDEDGLKLDDIGRPTLKIKHHDWELTGFAAVVERHGEASVEARQFARFEEAYGQLMLFDPKTLRNIGVEAAAKKAVAKFKNGMDASGIDKVTVKEPGKEEQVIYDRKV